MAPQPPSFPLPDAQLPAIRVSAAQHEELRAFLLPMAREVVRDGPSWGRTNVASARAAGWKLVADSTDSCFLTRTSGKSYRGFGADAAAKRAESREEGADVATAALQPPPTAGQCFMGYSVSPYSLEDVMSSVYCETTEELRAHFSNTYGAVCLDCCVLATLEGATLEDPFWYVGIKWLALKSPVKKLVSSREFVFLELSGSHVQSDGRRMLYRILQSVDIRGYGGKSSYFGLTRGHIEAAFVYWADDARSTPDKPLLNVCTKGRAHLKGSLPLWLVQLYLKKFWNSKRSVRIEAVLQSAQSASDGSNGEAVGGDDTDGGVRSIMRKPSRKDIRRQSSDDASSSSDSMPLEMATTWVPNESRAACYVCQKKFQLMRRPKHHCRSCGEVICSDCTSYSKLSVPPMLTRSGSALSEPRSTKSESAATTTQPSRSSRRLGRARESYVTVGKVCHRCMDLKSIMHNNSTRLNLTVAHAARDAAIVSGKRDDGREKDQYESLSTFYPSREGTSDRDRRSVGSSTQGGEVITTRIGRESSLSSSEVRAIIESNRVDSKSDKLEATSGEAAPADFKTQLDAIAFDAVAYDDVDDDDDDSNVDLEFHPVLANDVPTHELVGDTNGADMVGSVSLFNPDGLFNLEDDQVESSSDDDESESSDDENAAGATSDSGATDAKPSKDSPGAAEHQWQHQEPSQLPFSSLSTSTRSTGTGVASPTRPSSLLRSTSSWSRRDESAANANASTATGDGHVSLEDVKLAIADHVKLLEVIKREHQHHDAP